MNSGIYIIINSLSNKCYIGQASNIPERFARHRYLLKKGIHFSKHLQAAYNKYGISSFTFDILETCEKDKQVLTNLEQHYLDYFKYIGADLYNVAPIAQTVLGIRHSDESNKRKSLRQLGKSLGPHSEETRRKCGEKNIGRKLSDEHKKKINPAGRLLSEDTKKKISDSHKGRSFSDSHRENLKLAWELRRVRNNTNG